MSTNTIDWKKVRALAHQLAHGKVSAHAVEIVRAARSGRHGIASFPPDEGILAYAQRIIQGKPFADRHANTILNAVSRFDRRFLTDLIRAMDFVEGKRGIAQEDALSILQDYESYITEHRDKFPNATDRESLPTAELLRTKFLKRKPSTFQSGHRHSNKQIRNLFKGWKLPLGKGQPGRPKK